MFSQKIYVFFLFLIISSATSAPGAPTVHHLSYGKLLNAGIESSAVVSFSDFKGNSTQISSLLPPNEAVKRSQIMCKEPLVPGITWMSRGVDITRLDLFPSDLRVDSGFKSSIFAFTCSLNRTWKHPKIEASRLYSVPDQIAALNTVPAGELNIKNQFYSTLKDVKLSFGVSVGIEANFVIGSFSASLGYKQAKENILRSNKSIYETSATVSAVQMDFESPKSLQLNSKFTEMLDSLPVQYETAPEKYDAFLETFGTHYFGSAKYGGILYQKTIIENNFIYAKTERNITNSMKLSFFGKIAASRETDVDYKEITEEFKENTEINFYYYGGNIDLSKIKDPTYLHDWQAAVIHDPWLFGGQLMPIETLVQNETLQGEVKKASSVKRARAFLKDFRETLLVGRITLSEEQLQRLATIDNYLTHPKDQKEGLSELSQMEGEIEDLFEKVEEIRDRALLTEYNRKLENLWAGELLEAKYNLTVKQCITTQVEEKLQWQFDLIASLNRQLKALLTMEGKPDSPTVLELVRQVAQFLPTVEQQFQSDSVFCGSDSTCQSCAESHVKFETNWAKYATFYYGKVADMWNSSLACKVSLVSHCKSPLQAQLNTTNLTQTQILANFANAHDASGPPSKWQMKEWVLSSSQLAIVSETSVNLCAGNSSCQECLEYNVNCWNSNPDYLNNWQVPCKTANELRVIKHKLATIETDCQEKFMYK